MPVLELTPDEKKELLAILERYYPELQSERANTEDREYRKDLERREACMDSLINKIKKISEA